MQPLRVVEVSVGLTSLLMRFINFNFFASVQAVIDHSYHRDLLPLPIVVRSNIQERQLASKVFCYFVLGKLNKVFFGRRYLRFVSKWKHGEWN